MEGLLWYFATAIPSSYDSYTRYKQEKTLIKGRCREFYEIANSTNIWFKGREAPVEIDRPLVVYKTVNYNTLVDWRQNLRITCVTVCSR